MLIFLFLAVKDEDLYRERLTFQPWTWTVMPPSIDHSV
jgi:hypothetical protein